MGVRKATTRGQQQGMAERLSSQLWRAQRGIGSLGYDDTRKKIINKCDLKWKDLLPQETEVKSLFMMGDESWNWTIFRKGSEEVSSSLWLIFKSSL